jgi:hypothetical protein
MSPPAGAEDAATHGPPAKRAAPDDARAPDPKRCPAQRAAEAHPHKHTCHLGSACASTDQQLPDDDDYDMYVRSADETATAWETPLSPAMAEAVEAHYTITYPALVHRRVDQHIRDPALRHEVRHWVDSYMDGRFGPDEAHLAFADNYLVRHVRDFVRYEYACAVAGAPGEPFDISRAARVLATRICNPVLRFDDRTAGLLADLGRLDLLGLHDGLLDPDCVADPLVCPKPRPEPTTTSFEPPGAGPKTPPPSAEEPRISLVHGASEEPHTVCLDEPEEPHTECLDAPPCYESLVEERARRYVQDPVLLQSVYIGVHKFLEEAPLSPWHAHPRVEAVRADVQRAYDGALRGDRGFHLLLPHRASLLAIWLCHPRLEFDARMCGQLMAMGRTEILCLRGGWPVEGAWTGHTEGEVEDYRHAVYRADETDPVQGLEETMSTAPC